jgi:hypothetical protein
VIGSGVGSLVGAATALGTAVLLANAPMNYTVFVNEAGFGQPKPLFDIAEQKSPELKLSFAPPELRGVYVCEFKRVTGDSWKNMVLEYLDTYRDCFDVSARSENSYVIFANQRSSRVEVKEGTYLCKCNK